jgi:GT2 family glycosyltransferase
VENKKVKLIIGFITYGENTAKYLPYFLDSLEQQTYSDFGVIAVDNSDKWNNPNREYFQKNKRDWNFEWLGANLGFAKANNHIFTAAQKFKPEYIMFLNPDTIMEPDAVERMVEAMDANSHWGSLSPKIRIWDFDNKKKTEIIDSAGIVLRPGLRFADLGQGETDSGQFDRAKILGPSGTAPMYRLKALLSVERNNNLIDKRNRVEIFDERMFMYKEDCDLAYRLFLGGWMSGIAPGAVVYHHRTASGLGESNLKISLNRRNKSRQVKRWSFYNQHLIFLKFWGLQSSWDKILIISYALKMLVFVLVFEPYLLGEYFKLARYKKL